MTPGRVCPVHGAAPRPGGVPVAVSGLLLGLMLAAGAFARQEGGEDRAFLEELRRSFARGGSHAAVRDLEEYLVDFPASPVARNLAAEVALERGRLDEAGAHLAATEDPDRGLRARLLLRRGEYEAALALAGEGGGAPLADAWLEVQALDGLGRRVEARQRARAATETVDDRELDGAGLLDLARLDMFLRRFERANQALVYADAELNGRQGPGYRLAEPETLVLLGRVYQETRQGGGGGPDPALTVLNEVLELDAGHPAALVVKARVYDYGMNGGAAREALDRALDRDPTHPEALVLRGRMALQARRADAALADAERVLATNPRERGALALRAAALAVSASSEAQAAREEFARLHPESAAFEALLGKVLQDHYRFEDSLAPLERALTLEPEDESPLPVLAQSLAHLGREQEARAALEEHRRRSPFEYPWRANMLRVLARLRESVVVEDGAGTLRLYLPPGEQDVLGALLLERLDEARRDMRTRWGVALDDPVLVEVFDRHEDFSVRTVGFTGFLALGACFGDLFTMLSPLSEMRGQFVWAQTAVHEFAHVVTLELSDNRVPRWLTEGISVVEEHRVRPSWARELERPVLDARANGRLFPVDRLDEAFRDGDTVMLGYYQGSLLVEVIERDFGFDALRRLVAAYADDRSTAEAIRHALGIEPAELDARLEDYLDEVVVPRARLRPRYTPEGKDRLRARVMAGDDTALLPLARAYHDLGKQADRDAVLKRYLDRHGETPEVLAVLAERDAAEGRSDAARERYGRWLEDGEPEADGVRALATLALAEGDRDEALRLLHRAHALFPGDVGPDSAALLLLELLDADDEEWERVAADVVAHDEKALVLRVKLARRYRARQHHAEALELVEQAVDIDPYMPSLRMLAADWWLEQGDVERAARHWRLVIATRAHQVPEGLPRELSAPSAGGADTMEAIVSSGPGRLHALQERARRLLREHVSDEPARDA